MFTITGGEGHGRISVWCQILDNCFEGVDSRFFEDVLTATNFDVHNFNGCNMGVICWVVRNFLRDHTWDDADVMVIFHGGAEVEVFDVYAKARCAFAGTRDCAVWSLASSIETAGELGLPGKTRRFLLDVIRTRQVYFFWGLKLQTQFAYNTVQSAGKADVLIKILFLYFL